MLSAIHKKRKRNCFKWCTCSLTGNNSLGQLTQRPLEMSSLSCGFGLTTGGQETNGDLLKRVAAAVDQA